MATDIFFVSPSQAIKINKDQGRKEGLKTPRVRLDISMIYTDYDSNIKGCHRNAILPDEGSNNIPNTDLDTASKSNIAISQFAK